MNNHSEYVTTDLNGTTQFMRKIVHDCVVDINRDDEGNYNFSIYCAKDFKTVDDALYEARRMIEDNERRKFVWTPLVEL